MSIVLADPQVSHLKLQQFLDRWPRNSVDQMQLANYSQVGNTDTFTYWLEYGSESLGRIGGVLSSAKYGIWSRKADNEGSSPLYAANEYYKWAIKYGNTPELAFERIKTLILKIIDYSLQGQFDMIDAIEINALVKWKIAFIYSDYRLLPIYKTEVIRKLGKHFEHPDYARAPLSQLYKFILSFKETEEDFFDFSSRYYQIADNPSTNNYYIIGSKYENENGEDNYNIFPTMLEKGAISTGYFWGYNFSHLVGANHAKIENWSRKNIPATTAKFNTSLRTMKYFLNLKKGDIIAIKSHGRFNRLTIIAYAVVKEVDGSVYKFGDDDLGHLVFVDFLETGLSIRTELNYAQTIHKITPGEKNGHFEKIFGSYSITGSEEQFDDQEEYDEPNPTGDDEDDQDDIRDKNVDPYTRTVKTIQIVNQVHNTIQIKFARYLKQKFPNDRVKTERSRIDIWRRNDEGFYIYEVKPYQTAYGCIREALGQLTDYAFSKASSKTTHLVVVGIALPEPKDIRYINFLKSNLGLNFSYECYSIDANTSVSYPII